MKLLRLMLVDTRYRVACAFGVIKAKQEDHARLWIAAFDEAFIERPILSNWRVKLFALHANTVAFFLRPVWRLRGYKA